jgi:DUF1680 family protein
MQSRRSFLQCVSLAGVALYSGVPLLAQEGDAHPLEEFGYGDVALAPGLAQTQFEQTQAVLLSLNDDSLLKPWRLRAGLPAPGPDLGGWYDEVVPFIETPSGGHGYAPAHCFGQWLSALARGYAIDHDPATRAKLQGLLEMYSGAISGRFYANFRYPAYNYDKMVNGLVDAHRLADIPNAFELLDRTTDAAEPHLPPRGLDRSEESQWRISIGEPGTKQYTRDESYTLPENLYLAAHYGAGERYRKLAQRFLIDDTFFNPLSKGTDVLANHHAYSYFNSLNSSIQAYISDGSRMHLLAAKNGFDMIVANQSFATGGWGPTENFFIPGTGALYESLTNTHRSFETPCGSFAHLKLTRYLLRLSRDGAYGDSMERVVYNTVLGAKTLQHDGHAFYYSDYNNDGGKTYFPDAWPCCSGTLPQVAADYRILCYFHDSRGLYVNLYLPSTLHCTTPDGAQLALTQRGEYPIEGRIKMAMKLSRRSSFALRLRIPAWCAPMDQVVLHINGVRQPVKVSSGFAEVDRSWKNGDRVDLELPLPMRLEAIDPEHPDTVAMVRGPLVLFAMTNDAPALTRHQLLAAKRIPGRSAWEVATAAGSLQLLPFTEIDEEPYRTYLQVG